MSTTAVAESKQQTITGLQVAYAMELESVANYLAHSVNLDGVMAEEVKKSLAADVQEELGHATQLAQRIKQLGGEIELAEQIEFGRSSLEPLSNSTDVEAVIRGVLDDERTAIEHYRRMIRETDGHDYVTQDLCIKLLADEEQHRTQFESFLCEFTCEQDD